MVSVNSLANLDQTSHGHCTNGLSPTYNSWRKMIERINNPKDISYHNYGARGITLRAEWLKFEGFLKDMGVRPEGTSLDRINVNDGYNPENCRWATKKVQGNNTRTNRIITVDGISKTMTEWSDITGVKVGTIWRRLQTGRTPEEALSKTDLRNSSQALKLKELLT